MAYLSRYTVLYVQLGSLGSAVSSPQWDPGTKPQKILAILHSEQAQNIALAVQRQ